MRDPVLLEQGDLFPDPEQHLIGEQVGVDVVERRPVDHVVGEQEPVAPDCGHGAHPRCADTHVARRERNQGLVFDRASQRRERPFVTDVAQPQHSVDAEQQISGALVGSQHLHEQALAALQGREPGHRTPGIDRGALEGCHVQSAAPQRLENRRHPGLGGRSAVGHQHRRSHCTSDGQDQERMGGDPAGHREAQHHHHRDQPGARPSPTAADERCDREECSNDLGCCGDVGARVDRQRVGTCADRGGAVEVTHPGVDRSDHQCRQEVGGEHVAEEPPTPRHQRHDEHDQGGEHRGRDEHRVQGEPDRADVDAHEGADALLETVHAGTQVPREKRHDDRCDREDERPEHVQRRSFIGDDLGVEVEGLFCGCGGRHLRWAHRV